MKRVWAAAMAAGLAMAGLTMAQDMPGLGAGGFYETRVDNEVDGDELEMTYYGGRILLRDARWFQVFADLGSQEFEWKEYESDAEAFFGIGGTLWFVRAEDLMIPLDVGLYGSFHQGDVEIEPPFGPSYDGEYLKLMGQLVIRAAGYGPAMPYLRAGVMKSDLDMDEAGDDGDWNVTNPAINVGLEFAPVERFSLVLEGNYSEGVGFHVGANLWF